jgi:hypothetical protein
MHPLRRRSRIFAAKQAPVRLVFAPTVEYKIMNKLIIGAILAAGVSTAAYAAHNPTPPEGYGNYGQCRSALAQEQNEVRKTPEEYTEEQADDINGATCERQANGSYRIIF